jgi:hypothetical protein
VQIAADPRREGIRATQRAAKTLNRPDAKLNGGFVACSKTAFGVCYLSAITEVKAESQQCPFCLFLRFYISCFSTMVLPQYVVALAGNQKPPLLKSISQRSRLSICFSKGVYMSANANPSAKGAAQLLRGQRLDGGWTVGDKIDMSQTTGGYFSTCYYAVHESGTRAFLKAYDYVAALTSPDPAMTVNQLTAAFLFERTVVERCRDRRMDRVVRAITAGKVVVAGAPMGGIAEYLIFELGDNDVRQFVTLSQEFDIAWALRSLHHIATAIWQLHSGKIAHQDLKPSNVVVFDRKTSKVGDFGRSACKDIPSPHDDKVMPGDWHYAPPEQFYGYKSPEWNVRRLSPDLYQFGSMVVFFFTNASMTSLLFSQMHQDHLPGKWTGTFEEVMPYLRDAFGKALEKFGTDIDATAPSLRSELCEILKYLCDPDPTLRGHPGTGRGVDQYSMERFVSRFDRLALRSEMNANRGF